MAIDWGAFIGGVAKSASNRMEERSKEEREQKMLERRMELAEKYKVQEETRAEARAKKKVTDEKADYANGVAILYNADREQIGTRPLTAAEIEDRSLATEGTKLDIQNKRSTIEERARDSARQDEALRLDRARTGATIENLRSGGGRGSSGRGSDDADETPLDRAGLSIVDRVAANLIKSYGGKETEELTQAQLWSQARNAAETAARAGRPDQAMALFVDSLNNKTKVQGRRGR